MLSQKAYNAREGIETYIRPLDFTLSHLLRQKAYNAREGIETLSSAVPTLEPA